MMDTALGLDTSHHQPTTLDWARVGPEDGISFGITRFAYGLLPDKTFDNHLSDMIDHGVWAGAYMFPVASQNIDEQAILFANSPHHRLQLPMFLDVETDNTQDTQINADQTRRFLEVVARITGKLPGVYTSKVEWERLIGLNKTWGSRYWLWVAHHNEVIPYPDLPDVWTNYLIWQHKVAPINSYDRDIDQNRWNGSIQDIECQFRDPYVDWFFKWPTDSARITQEFGENEAHYGRLLPVPVYGNVRLGHDGIDIGLPIGSNIYAAQNGIVKELYNHQFYGIHIRLDHGNGLGSLYGHLQKTLVKIGDRVTIGQKIALSGNTGASTGPHCHFRATRHNATAMGWTSYPSDIVNPTRWLRLPEPPPSPSGVTMRMKYTEGINIRAEPKLSSLDIGDVAAGEVVTAYPPAVGDYLKITAHGIAGYSLAKHFEIVVTQPVKLRCTATTYVNVRSSPEITATNDIGDLPGGAIIMGFVKPGDAYWEVIQADGSHAWIASQWLEVVL